MPPQSCFDIVINSDMVSSNGAKGWNLMSTEKEMIPHQLMKGLVVLHHSIIPISVQS